MVVTHRATGCLPLLAPLTLALLSGCAAPHWFWWRSETDLTNPPPTAARVYPRAALPQSQASANPYATSTRRETQPPSKREERPAASPATPDPKTVVEAPPSTAVETAAAPTRLASTQLTATPVSPPMDLASEFVAQEPQAKETTDISPKELQQAATEEARKPGEAVEVQPEPIASDKEPPKDEKPHYQAGDWLKVRDQAITSLQEEILLAKADAARSGEVPQLETLLRLHLALAGRRDEAAAPVGGLREAEQEFWRHQAIGLVDLLGPDRIVSESRRFAVALKSLQEAEARLAAASSLTLRNLAFCRKVQDFGVIERFPRHDFARNQEVLLYVEVRNFAAVETAEHTFETELQGSFRVLNRSGAAVAERTLPLDKQTNANLRRDYYIAYRIYIPSELPPGAYTLELTIEDRKGNKSNNSLLDFNVVQ